MFAYDEPLSHIIYAAADMLLVPSMFEPCGLTQVGNVVAWVGCAGLHTVVLCFAHDLLTL